MRKLKSILRETYYLIRQHKLYFMAPLLLLLCVLSILFFHLGPSIIISFIYAGV